MMNDFFFNKMTVLGFNDDELIDYISDNKVIINVKLSIEKISGKGIS